MGQLKTRSILDILQFITLERSVAMEEIIKSYEFEEDWSYTYIPRLKSQLRLNRLAILRIYGVWNPVLEFNFRWMSFHTSFLPFFIFIFFIFIFFPPNLLLHHLLPSQSSSSSPSSSSSSSPSSFSCPSLRLVLYKNNFFISFFFFRSSFILLHQPRPGCPHERLLPFESCLESQLRAKGRVQAPSRELCRISARYAPTKV